MLGVVIWSAEAESKAIIWCEDHGELAFLGQTPHSTVSAERFREGDLIQFDLTELDNLRFARNPKRIAQHYCSDLGSVLENARAVKNTITVQKKDRTQGCSALIDFDQAKQMRACKMAAAAR